MSGNPNDPQLATSPIPPKYVELAHVPLVRIWDRKGKSEGELLGFPGAPPSFQEARYLGQVLADVVRKKKWEFDTICTLSAFALPMAYSLMNMNVVDKECRVIACDNETGSFLPESFVTDEHGKQVLLLDVVVQTGQHLERAWRALENQGHVVVGFIAIIENDMLLNGQEQTPFLKALLKDGKKAVSLTKASAMWRALARKERKTTT